jgi:hypothetical protein
MHLDDVWLQTTLNTPNVSGVWQIRKCSLVSLKAHQPRQGQSPLAGLFFLILSLFSVLSKLRQVHTYYVFFSK